MKEILFRGKRLDNGEWVDGYLAAYDLICPDYPEDTSNATGDYYGQTPYVGFVEVDRSTVGQFTGLTDNNGKRIFEGDIVDILTENEEIGVVEYKDGGFLVSADGFCVDFHSNINGTDLEVIDNIHDNPELLEGTDNGHKRKAD